jgi:hypothetical protein
VDDRGPDSIGMAKRHLQRDAATGAGAKQHGGSLVEGGQQRGGVVGLLGDRSLRPAGRAGAAGVAAPVVGGDGEPVSEGVGHPGELGGVAAGTGDQQYGRTAAAGLGVQDGAIGPDPMGVQQGGVLGHGTASSSEQSEQQELRRFRGYSTNPRRLACWNLLYLGRWLRRVPHTAAAPTSSI